MGRENAMGILERLLSIQLIARYHSLDGLDLAIQADQLEGVVRDG